MPQSPKPRIGLAGTLNLKNRGRDVAPEFSTILEDLGFEVIDSGDVDILINLNHNWKSLAEITNPETFTVLIRLEPEAVYPTQYSKNVESKYSLVLTPGMPVGLIDDFIPWPYQYQENPLRPKSQLMGLSEVLQSPHRREMRTYKNWSRREIFCSMIAANKVSPNGKGNYSLRREFAFLIDDQRLQIFGELWRADFKRKLRYRFGVLKFAIASSSSFVLTEIFLDSFRKYPRVKGEISDKHVITNNSKFSLVIENSNTYVSEKLFDALISGSLPVYFGPDLNLTPLSEDLVIRYSGPISEFVFFLEGLSPAYVEAKLESIEAFLESPEILDWDATTVYRKIARSISIRYNGGL
jgi:hypothetical protein